MPREIDTRLLSNITTQALGEEETATLATSLPPLKVSGKQPAPTTPAPRRTMESLLCSMLDNPSFIEELRMLMRRNHYDLEGWSPLDTDILTKDIIQFMREQLVIEARRRR
jgi:hypothetical protein